MNDKIALPNNIAASISLLYFLISVVVITAIYYVAPLIILNWYSFYERIGADIPSLTYFILYKYNYSYVLCLFVLFFSSRFYIQNEKSGVNIKPLIWLNALLLLCVSWFALVVFALQIPIQHMARLQ